MQLFGEIFGVGFLQSLLFVLVAPLLHGITNKVKAFLQKRRGASIFQAYFDLWKWWRKPTMVTPHTSPMFLLAPPVLFATVFLAAMMAPGVLLPYLSGDAAALRYGDAFIFVALLALGRFFITLGALDSATAFGGMGSSRELYVSVLVEPAVLLAILVNALCYHSTTLSRMVIDYDALFFTVPAVLTCVAFFMLILAENSRLPVDNPDTHLELTMLEECMTLEYSGRLLALLHLAGMLKVVLFLVLFGTLYLPIAIPLAVKVVFGAVLIGVTETLCNKMRLFKVRIYLAAALILLIIALMAK